MGRGGYRFLDDAEKRPYFLTCRALNWLPLLNRPATAQVVLDSLAFLCREGRLTLFAYVILENHLHLVAEADDLSKEIGDFKSYTARTNNPVRRGFVAEPRHWRYSSASNYAGAGGLIEVTTEWS